LKIEETLRGLRQETAGISGIQNFTTLKAMKILHASTENLHRFDFSILLVQKYAAALDKRLRKTSFKTGVQ
jgi:hypothetical protein